jgi:hypothetical protein
LITPAPTSARAQPPLLLSPRPRPQGVLRSGIDLRTQLHKVTKDQFPLPTLGPVLEGVREEVRAGRGFALVRGFPVHRWAGNRACECAFDRKGMVCLCLRVCGVSVLVCVCVCVRVCVLSVCACVSTCGCAVSVSVHACMFV